MTVEDLIPPEGITGLVALILMGAFWFSATVAILCIMEVSHDFLLDPDRRVNIRSSGITYRVCLLSCMPFGCIGWRGTASIITPGDM